MSNTIYHIHHIIPRYMGGTDDPSNLIKLTIEEHAEAHRKLYEEYSNKEDYLAWKMLLGQMEKSEYIFERAKLGGHKSSNKGYIPTEEHKKKISQAKLGVPRPNLTGANHPRATAVVIGNNEFDTIGDAAAYHSVSRVTIRNWIKSGKCKKIS